MIGEMISRIRKEKGVTKTKLAEVTTIYIWQKSNRRTKNL